MTCLSSSKIRRYLPTYLLLVPTYKNAESRQVVPVGTYFSFGLFLQEHCFELFLLVHSVVVVPEIYFLWLIIPFKTIWFFGREQKMIGSLLKKQRSDKSTKVVMGRAWKSRARAGPGLGPSGSGGPGLEPFSGRRAPGGLGRASGFHYILIFVFLFSLYVQKSLTSNFSISLCIDISPNRYKK